MLVREPVERLVVFEHEAFEIHIATHAAVGYGWGSLGGWFPALMNHFQNLREPPDWGEENFAEPFSVFVHLWAVGLWRLNLRQ